ncbi:MAG TPA: chitobiase/beta-hexosaminidase C-terminal domain-containing protein, partial [Opitutaceae bacterium]|nr:chitobiase/beta-hexosaminidase C-terminal domain-containing protein [Opitutaceae bacterium]
MNPSCLFQPLKSIVVGLLGLLAVSAFAQSGTPITLEAEKLSPAGSGATVSTSNDANASGGVLEFLNATTPGQSITFTTPVLPASVYQIQFRYKTNKTRGQHTIMIDQTVFAGIIDQYAATQAYKTVTLSGLMPLGAGAHTITLTVTGRNASATQYYLSADSFTLTPNQVQVSAPVFSPAGGTYATAQNVTITSPTTGALIRYTTDGSTPSETAGTVYSGPVNISATTTLQAIAYVPGFVDSPVTSASYAISPPPLTYNFEAENLPYVSIGGPAIVVPDRLASGGRWVELEAAGLGANLTFTVPTPRTNYYQLSMEWEGGPNRGIVQLSVDGQPVGLPVDQYSPLTTYRTTNFGNV